MRSDMKKILITRGRRGSKDSQNDEVVRLRRQPVEDDETGSKRSMLPRKLKGGWGERKIDNKGDFLAPIYRYLNGCVGQRWDDVYSEICKVNDKSSTIGAHAYSHIKGHIEEGPTYKDQEGNIRMVENDWLVNGLYVDKDGIIQDAGPYKRPKPEPRRIVLYTIDRLNFLVQNKKGIWFKFTYSDEYEEIWSRVAPLNPDNLTLHKTLSYKHKEVNVDSQDYEIVPGNTIGSNWRSPKNYRAPDEKRYLISLKTLSTKEKKEYGII